MANKEIREDKNVKLFQTLTGIFAFLFLITMVFYTVPNMKQIKLDVQCKSLGLDYAKTDMLRGQYSCCKIHKVSDWEAQMTYQKEGCTSPFDLPTIKGGIK